MRNYGPRAYIHLFTLRFSLSSKHGRDEVKQTIKKQEIGTKIETFLLGCQTPLLPDSVDHVGALADESHRSAVRLPLLIELERNIAFNIS